MEGIGRRERGKRREPGGRAHEFKPRARKIDSLPPHESKRVLRIAQKGTISKRAPCDSRCSGVS